MTFHGCLWNLQKMFLCIPYLKTRDFLITDSPKVPPLYLCFDPEIFLNKKFRLEVDLSFKNGLKDYFYSWL